MVRISRRRIGPLDRATITATVHLSPKMCLTSCTSRTKYLSSWFTFPPSSDLWRPPRGPAGTGPDGVSAAGPKKSPLLAGRIAMGERKWFTRIEQRRVLFSVRSGLSVTVQEVNMPLRDRPLRVQLGDPLRDQLVVAVRTDPASAASRAGQGPTGGSPGVPDLPPLGSEFTSGAPDRPSNPSFFPLPLFPVRVSIFSSGICLAPFYTRHSGVHHLYL